MIDRQLRNTLMLTHGGLMAFVWLVAVPMAVGASMYARKKNKTWGIKVHMVTMATAAFLPFTISALMAFYVAGSSNIYKPHSSIGTVLTFGAWIQVILGITNHCIFRYRLKNDCLPSGRPWNNRVHIWFGKILMVLALINIPLGMKVKRLSTTIFILYAVWITLLAIMFIYLIWMKQEGINMLNIKAETFDDDDSCERKKN